MRSRTVGAGQARPAAFQYVHAYPYKLEVAGHNILSTCLSLLIKQNAFDKQ